MSKKMITPVILAGGSGTRLSPLSTPDRPKQFLPLLGAHSLLQQTALRFAQKNLHAPLIICHQRHRFLAAHQLHQIGMAHQILLEPKSRNTAAAILAAALHSLKTEPNATLLIAPSDHHITDESTFHKALHQAETLAKNNQWVLFGITPTRPETGYGYIKQGKIIQPNAFAATGFCEKPSPYTAQKLVNSGDHVWNSGMFVARADFIVQQFRALQQDLFNHVSTAYKSAHSDKDFIWLNNSYGHCPNISIDVAIMENSPQKTVIPLDIGWSDLGSFTSLSDALPRKNRIERPWGHYSILFSQGQRCVKELVIQPGKRTSLQQHNHRSEHWIITRGQASIQKDNQHIKLAPSDQITIPQHCLHRLSNTGKQPLHLIEIQTGNVLSEDDITRFDDDYGRHVQAHPALTKMEK